MGNTRAILVLSIKQSKYKSALNETNLAKRIYYQTEKHKSKMLLLQNALLGILIAATTYVSLVV